MNLKISFLILLILSLSCRNDKIIMEEDVNILPGPSKQEVTFNTDGGSEVVTVARDFEIAIKPENSKVRIDNVIYEAFMKDGVITELRSDWVTIIHPYGTKNL